DDYAVPDENYIGIKGWYLWHDRDATTIGGANGHQHFRYNAGGSTFTGFAAYSTFNGDRTEKALGIMSANGINGNLPGEGRAYIGLQLINDTGATLHSFTITYDGEQYLDRGTATGLRDGFDLQWSLVTTASGWKSSNTSEVGGFYDGVSGVD